MKNARTTAPMPVKKRTNMGSKAWRDAAPADSGTEQLRLGAGAQLRRNCANETWFQSELQKNPANLADGDGRFVDLEINDVVIAVDLVAEARHRFELMIEFQDFVQVADTGRINFQFDHDNSAKCKQPAPAMQN